MTPYIVASQLELGMYTTDTPEQAVAAFLRDHDLDVKVKVYVADYIGDFQKQTTIYRHPNKPPKATKPDSPKAMSTVPGPNNIKQYPQSCCQKCGDPGACDC